ncbi:MAG: glycosyltransferase [Alphaproteobacteria bacterium]|nr:glycosyltransferase [Alphaproteobacteria bacterium]
MPRLSIIVPVLDEAAGIADALKALAPFRANGAEVVVADGGSRDRTVEIARPLADATVSAPRGRGAQMNAGAAAAGGDALLFLHADTRLPPEADRLLLDGLQDGAFQWGRFDVRIEGRSPLLPVVSGFMNWRSLVTGIATGDQAMFMTRKAFDAAGGFPDIALMEDVAMSKRLKRISRPLGLAARVTTSGRRWDERGALRTVLLMWRLRLEYLFGAEPNALARRYGYIPRDG